MTTFLWTLQIVLGIFFTLHGAALAAWAPPLRDALGTSPYPKSFLQFIGLCELSGGLGLILPWWLGIAPILTPLAAAGLAVIMVGAVVTHAREREMKQVVALSSFTTLLLIVAFIRWYGLV